jgi:hypothetical protein
MRHGPIYKGVAKPHQHRDNVDEMEHETGTGVGKVSRLVLGF